MRCAISLCFSWSSANVELSGVATPSSAVRGMVKASSIWRRDSIKRITCPRTHACCLLAGSCSWRRHSSSVAIWFFTRLNSAKSWSLRCPMSLFRHSRTEDSISPTSLESSPGVAADAAAAKEETDEEAAGAPLGGGGFGTAAATAAAGAPLGGGGLGTAAPAGGGGLGIDMPAGGGGGLGAAGGGGGGGGFGAGLGFTWTYAEGKTPFCPLPILTPSDQPFPISRTPSSWSPAVRDICAGSAASDAKVWRASAYSLMMNRFYQT
mmetsp:Transcript_33591/g.68673  ORF Transcript_33591/g.68673 Transcript_33591/m.68673 type:complete len:265 (-) Transcript_33591:77-871(-)